MSTIRFSGPSQKEVRLYKLQSILLLVKLAAYFCLLGSSGIILLDYSYSIFAEVAIMPLAQVQIVLVMVSVVVVMTSIFFEDFTNHLILEEQEERRAPNQLLFSQKRPPSLEATFFISMSVLALVFAHLSHWGMAATLALGVCAITLREVWGILNSFRLLALSGGDAGLSEEDFKYRHKLS